MSKSSLGIDLGSRRVRAVLGEKRGPVFVLKRAITVEVPFADDPEAGVLAAASEVKARLGKELKAAAGARFGLSGKDLIIRYTTVPPVPLWRLRLLMDFEVREMSAAAGGALASDYNLVTLPDAKDGEETVLVAVCKESFLDARYAAVRDALGDPRAGTPASVALFNAFVACGDMKEGEYTFLVDLGDRNVEIVLQKDGELLFARNLNAGGRMLTEAVAATFNLPHEQAEEVKHDFGNVAPRGMASYASGKEEKVAGAIIGPVGRLSAMIQSSLAFTRAQTKIKDLQVGRILLSGGGANLRGLPEYLSAAFKCPVERFVPENGLDLSQLPEDEAREFQADPGAFAIAVGLARTSADDQAFKIDIVPTAEKAKRRFKERTLFMWLSAAVAVLYLGWNFFDAKSTRDKLKDEASQASRLAERSKQQRKAFDSEQARIVDLNRKSAELAAFTEPGWALPEAQRLVQRACPEGVWIESIEVRRELAPDPADPNSKVKIRRTMVYVTGQANPQLGQPDKELNDLVTGIQSAAKGCEVSILQKRPALAGVVEFKLSIDLFAERATS
ncbi:MAG TPA: pilus assembly protein PilM [Planctomycetota bacterium]|nr:pilus assembly protein PilM [Planctomycetota bacterium]